MVDRLNELAVCKEDYCYFPGLYYARTDALIKMIPSQDAEGNGRREVNGRLGRGLTACYKLTGYKPRLDWAESVQLCSLSQRILRQKRENGPGHSIPFITPLCYEICRLCCCRGGSGVDRLREKNITIREKPQDRLFQFAGYSPSGLFPR